MQAILGTLVWRPSFQQDVSYPLFCYNATGGYDCITTCADVCGYAKNTSTLETDCLSQLPPYCTVPARPKYTVDLLPSSCSTKDATRFQFSPLTTAVKPTTTTEVNLTKTTLLLESPTFTWANCNATQIWAVGQLVKNPTVDEVADCSLPNAGYGERITPGDFIKPLQFELDLTNYFTPKFIDDDLTQQNFLFQLSVGADNTACNTSNLTVATMTIIQTISMSGLSPP